MPYTVPFTTFGGTDTIVATELNANFDDIAQRLSGNILCDTDGDVSRDLLRGSSLICISSHLRTYSTAATRVWARRRIVVASGVTVTLVRVDAWARLITATIQTQIRNNGGTDMLNANLVPNSGTSAPATTTTFSSTTTVASGDNVQFVVIGSGGSQSVTDLFLVSWWRARHVDGA